MAKNIASVKEVSSRISDKMEGKVIAETQTEIKEQASENASADDLVGGRQKTATRDILANVIADQPPTPSQRAQAQGSVETIQLQLDVRQQ